MPWNGWLKQQKFVSVMWKLDIELVNRFDSQGLSVWLAGDYFSVSSCVPYSPAAHIYAWCLCMPICSFYMDTSQFELGSTLMFTSLFVYLFIIWNTVLLEERHIVRSSIRWITLKTAKTFGAGLIWAMSQSFLCVSHVGSRENQAILCCFPRCSSRSCEASGTPMQPGWDASATDRGLTRMPHCCSTNVLFAALSPPISLFPNTVTGVLGVGSSVHRFGGGWAELQFKHSMEFRKTEEKNLLSKKYVLDTLGHANT